MADVYEVGIRLLLSGNDAEVLRTLASRLLGIKLKVDDLKNNFGLLKTAVGAAFALEGVKLFLGGINDVINKAKDLNDQLVRLRMAGVDPADTAAVESVAFKVAEQIPARPVASIVSDVRHLRGLLGEEPEGDRLGEVKKYLPKVEAAAAELGHYADMGSDQALAMILKSIDLRGDIVDPKTHHISAERFNAGLEAVTKFLIAANGLATPNDIQNLLKQGGPMARALPDPNNFYKMVLGLVLEMGGARAGTGLTAAGRQVFGARMPLHVAEEMENKGVLGKGGYEKTGGGYAVIDPEKLIGIDILRKQGLFEWEERVVKPELEKHGVTTPEKQNEELYQLFSTETFRRIMAFYMQQGEQVMRDAKLYDKVPSIDQNLKTLQNESLTYNMDAFTTSWNNMLAALGAEGIPAKIAVLQSFTNLFTDWTKGIREGPTPGAGPRFTAPPAAKDPKELLFMTDLPMVWFYRYLREHGWFGGEHPAAQPGEPPQTMVPPAGPPGPPADHARQSWLQWLGLTPAQGATPPAPKGTADDPAHVVLHNPSGDPPVVKLDPNGQALPVVVQNLGAVSSAVSANQARDVSRPPAGPTQADVRLNLPQPAFGFPIGGP